MIVNSIPKTLCQDRRYRKKKLLQKKSMIKLLVQNILVIYQKHLKVTVNWRASSDKRFSFHNLCNKVLHNIANHDQIIMSDVWLNLSPKKLNYSCGLHYLTNYQLKIIFSPSGKVLWPWINVFFVVSLEKLIIIFYFCAIRVGGCRLSSVIGGVLR